MADVRFSWNSGLMGDSADVSEFCRRTSASANRARRLLGCPSILYSFGWGSLFRVGVILWKLWTETGSTSGGAGRSNQVINLFQLTTFFLPCNHRISPASSALAVTSMWRCVCIRSNAVSIAWPPIAIAPGKQAKLSTSRQGTFDGDSNHC